MRYLGIDYGEKRVGLALSDESGSMGFPHRIVPNSPHLLDIILGIMDIEKVGAVVIGESRDLAGGENRVAAAARELGDAIEAKSGKEVFYESEVYTSALAHRQHDRAEKSRAPRERGPIDDSAAALILTSFLSREGHG